MKLTEHNEIVMEKFATMFVERMKQMKASDWKQGWCGKVVGTPVNIEGKQYKGGNVFFLMMDCALQNWEYPIYCTLKQANRLGAHVNKGSKSMPVIFWDFTALAPDGKKIASDTYKAMSADEQKRCKVRPFLKSYNVFNVAQTNLEQKQPDKVAALKQEFTPATVKDDSGMYKCEALDKMIEEQSWLCRIQNDRAVEGAFYSPARDLVIVPMKEQFRISQDEENIYKDGQEYYSALLHEMVHSTGTEGRLNREKGTRFGDPLYVREELVAEVTAARVGQVLGFDKRIIDNNACYCDGWINALRESPEYVLKLMGDVDKASRMILEKL
jgi:antirestriction protein ArdC